MNLANDLMITLFRVRNRKAKRAAIGIYRIRGIPVSPIATCDMYYSKR